MAVGRSRAWSWGITLTQFCFGSFCMDIRHSADALLPCRVSNKGLNRSADLAGCPAGPGMLFFPLPSSSSVMPLCHAENVGVSRNARLEAQGGLRLPVRRYCHCPHGGRALPAG